MHRPFDATLLAQKALSAVARLKEQYKSDYVIDFLTGSRSEKIPVEHRQFKTFGAGADISRQDWLNLIRDLISLGYMKRSPNDSLLSITEKGWQVLKGGEKVMLAQPPFSKREATVKTKSGRNAAPEHEPDLLQLLSELRKYLASRDEVQTEDIVPYLRLHQMATYLPDNKENLKSIAGFDAEQLRKYGSAFLKIINEYLEVNGLKSRMHLRRKK